MWIISSLIVNTISLVALIRIRFKIDRVGLGVIAFYNILFVLYFSSSIVTLVDDGDTAKIPQGITIMNSLLKNFDIAFKAYFTFEMYRVKVWL